jgi:hypothetical protein
MNGSVAMCISSHNSCTYSAGDQTSLIIEVTVRPYPDSTVRLTGLEFFERAPIVYNWLHGESGENNYPTKYGVRVLKNGSEIFRKGDNLTHPDWALGGFYFVNDDEFQVGEETTFRIEVLPYCLIGNPSQVSAWDIDEIKIYGGCVPIEPSMSIIRGKIMTADSIGISAAEIYISENRTFDKKVTRYTNEDGEYYFDEAKPNTVYYVKGYKHDDLSNGVSAIDLLLIQKHLLGKTSFTSLWQFIAADINHNGNVSAIDLVHLKKSLLGIYDQFPGNTIWRFGPMHQDLTGNDPERFNEIAVIEVTDQLSQNQDFIGIKIGDVNGDAKP